MVARPSPLTTASGATIRYLVTGIGPPHPVTVFAPGLGGDIESTRPLGSGVPGRKVFFDFGSSLAYPDLASDLAAVADHVAATRALGASLGAAALCTLLADRPDRFERLVFYLPAREVYAGLAAVTAPALVLACRDDPVHPVPVAQRLAATLPSARLYVFDRPDPVRTARAALRGQIAGFLTE